MNHQTTASPQARTAVGQKNKIMAIFGDVNDNRVIPLILLSGMIFLTGMLRRVPVQVAEGDPEVQDPQVLTG